MQGHACGVYAGSHGARGGLLRTQVCRNNEQKQGLQVPWSSMMLGVMGLQHLLCSPAAFFEHSSQHSCATMNLIATPWLQYKGLPD